MAKKRFRKPRCGDIILVEWLDSTGLSGGPWHSYGTLKRHGVATIRSVGYVHKWTKKQLVLHASISPNQCGEITAIPTACVQKAELLKKAKR